MLTLSQILKVNRLLEQTPRPRGSSYRPALRKRNYSENPRDSCKERRKGVLLELRDVENQSTGEIYLVATYPSE